MVLKKCQVRFLLVDVLVLSEPPTYQWFMQLHEAYKLAKPAQTIVNYSPDPLYRCGARYRFCGILGMQPCGRLVCWK